MCNEYSGWTNYETWAVKLWIDNEQSSQEYWRGQAQGFYDAAMNGKDDNVVKGVWTIKEAAKFNLSDYLKNEYEDMGVSALAESERAGTVFSDLLGAALSNVKWDEIADSLLEDITS